MKFVIEMNFKEAKVIVTGATGGIGYEIARTLRDIGATVIVSGRNAAKVRFAADEFGVYGCTADVSNETAITELFSLAVEQMGSANVLINNAGIGIFAALTDTPVADFQEVWEINVKGLFLAGKEAAKYFIPQNYGNIFNIGSTASLRGYANGSAYVASKFAVSGLTDCWRAELRSHNIRAMQINPSEVITDFVAKAGMEIKMKIVS